MLFMQPQNSEHVRFCGLVLMVRLQESAFLFLEPFQYLVAEESAFCVAEVPQMHILKLVRTDGSLEYVLLQENLPASQGMPKLSTRFQKNERHCLLRHVLGGSGTSAGYHESALVFSWVYNAGGPSKKVVVYIKISLTGTSLVVDKLNFQYIPPLSQISYLV